MHVLIQRVRSARVVVDDVAVAEIERGLLAFIGFEAQDEENGLDQALNKVMNYRVFSDENDKMNLSLKEVAGGLLLVPQFTLAADTRKGLRPSFSAGAPPSQAKRLFDLFVAQAREVYGSVQSGIFGADMQVELINDGPVTFNMRF